MKALGFDKELKLVELGLCPFCKQKVEARDFRDETSRREHGISGLCQPCQDEMFG
jgi:hypothetical protein